MPKAPDGTKMPQDHKPVASDPNQVPDGFELLKPPPSLEFWDVTEFMSLVQKIKVNGSRVEMTSHNVSVIGQIAKLMQEQLAVDSGVFRTWLNKDSFSEGAVRLVPVLYAYSAALGEANSSES